MKAFLKKPGQYFRYKKKFLRELYFQISKYLHFKTYYSRIYQRNFLTFILKKSDLINNKIGYKLINYSKLKEKKLNINEVLEIINTNLKNLDLNKIKNTNDGIITLKNSNDFNILSPELQFVTNKYLIEIVSRYLNCIPILTNLSLWYSPNDKIFENSSQEYHLDHEDYKQVKGFLFINDIDERTGPLSIINVLQSNEIQKSINYTMTKKTKRVNDEIIGDLIKKNINIQENVITGKSGDLLLCDTSSCFHYGSRLGSKARYILAFQYITPFGFTVDWNWRNYDKLPFKDLECENNLLLKKVLGIKI